MEIARRGPVVDSLRFVHDARQRCPDEGSAGAGAAHHCGQDITIQHSLNGNPLGCAHKSGSAPNGFCKRFRWCIRAAKQRAIDIEQDYCRGHSYSL
jgi:hypothetical protein